MVRFVRWLAKPAGPGDYGEPPVFEGILLTKCDYTRARFAEDPTAGGSVDGDSIRAWQAMMSGMAAGCGIDLHGWGTGDPEDIAEKISLAFESGDGPDAASVASSVIAMGVSLPSLPDPVRSAVKSRLGAFISGLTPTLRDQLLRVDAKSSR
jgi:hypothetical protein